jgi:prefoldin subunit 5
MPTAAATAVKPDNRQLLSEEEVLSEEEQQAVAAEATEEAPPPVLPAAQPQPQPPEQAAKPEAKPKKVPEEAVPYERFKQIWDEAKGKDQELAALRERWARLEERQNLAREAQERLEQQQLAEQQKAKIPPRPDETIDPYGAQLWERDRKIEALSSKLEELSSGLGQTTQQLNQSSQMNDFNLWLTSDINAYRAKQPDYEQAAQHARQARLTFWQSVGIPLQQAEAIVNNEALAIAFAAKQNNKSAAQAYYDAAKTMGYQGAAPTNGNGAAAAPPSAQEKMAQLKRGQAAQGLSRAPVLDDNNANWSALTAQQIADMDENDFVEALQDPQRAVQINKALERLEGVRQG